MSDYENYQPLTITAELMAPVIFDRRQPLDGIIGSAAVTDPELHHRYRGVERFNKNVRKHGLKDAIAWWEKNGWPIPKRRHFMPLAVFGHGVAHGLWVYHASAAIPAEFEHDLVHFNKRLDFEQVDRYVKTKKKKIATAKGEFGSKHIPFQTMSTAHLTWHVLGHRADLEEILSLVHFIGKKRRRGYGKIRAWHIRNAETDRSVFDGDTLMRPVPATLLDKLGIEGNFRYDYTTYRPPYHNSKFAARCAVAGDRHGFPQPA